MIRSIILALFATLAGCSMSRQSNPVALKRFSTVDEIRVRNVTLTGPADIERFRSIYANAFWEHFFATMPADVVCVACFDNRNEVLTLGYGGGCLWEPGGERVGRLDSADAEWLKRNVGDKLDVASHVL